MPFPLRDRFRGLTSGTWARTGVWAVADQALFAGANFGLNVLLARWLTPEGFGAYTVAYTVFLLLGTLHAGVLVEPMLVFGASRFRDRLPAYLRLLLSGHLRFAAGAAVLLAGGAVVFWTQGQLVLGHTLAAFAVGQSVILFQWLMRSACYVETRPQISATSGLLYAAVMLAGVVGLRAAGGLNESTGIGLMALASLMAAAVMAYRLGVPVRRSDDPALVADTVRRHRQYGGWAATTGALEWYHGFLPFLVLPFFGGLEDTGALRALFNLALPMLHVFTALTQMWVPVFVRALEKGTARRLATRIAWGLGAVTLLYGAAVELGGGALMHWLYDGQYDDYAHLLWIVAALPVVMGVSNLGQAILRAQERPEAVFAARVAASSVATTVGTALVAVAGVAGGLLSDLASALTQSALMVVWLRRGRRPVASVGDAPSGRRPHVLVVAFAFGPGRGSEPGQGWQTARGLAAHLDVTALVYAGFRPVVEAELAERPVPGLRVVFYHLPGEHPRHHAEGAERHGWREQVHYHLWQLGAARLAGRLHDATPFDAAQHASLMRYWSPSAAIGVGDRRGTREPVPVVWGPVGGGESVPAGDWRDALGARGSAVAWLRDTVRAIGERLPATRETARRATIALATTDESAARMRRAGATDVRVAPASVALTTEEVEALATIPLPPEGPVRFVTVGRMVAWKGYALALDAFARALDHPAMADATLTLVGYGSDRARLEARAQALGLGTRVRFTGRIPRPEALAEIGASHVLVHPSFHDSGGYATLEGMAAGRPVVCLALGGPALQVTPETGISVPAPSADAAVAGLSDAFVRLAADPALRARMGAAGRARVRDRFTWPHVIATILASLEEVGVRAAAALPAGGDGSVVSEPAPVGWET